MKRLKIGLLGSGSQSEEVSDFACGVEIDFVVSSFTEKSIILNDGSELDLALSGYDSLKKTSVLPAVGAPGLKRKFISLWPGDNYISIISENSWISSRATIGVGSIISPGAVIMNSTSLGRFVLVNVGATISHDTVIGDYSTVSPGVNIGGNCKIGSGVFLGIGCSISHGIRIADGSYIGAGTNIIKDIVQEGTYVGNPALRINDKSAWENNL